MARGDITTVDGKRFLELEASNETPTSIPVGAGSALPSTTTNPERFKAFAFIVDGEVAHREIYLLSVGSEGAMAALLSDPKVVEIPMDIVYSVSIGHTYANSVFSPPVV